MKERDNLLLAQLSAGSHSLSILCPFFVRIAQFVRGSRLRDRFDSRRVFGVMSSAECTKACW